ncbi:MAG: hypothetical protein WAX69_09000 [Victivallales bacterium]
MKIFPECFFNNSKKAADDILPDGVESYFRKRAISFVKGTKISYDKGASKMPVSSGLGQLKNMPCGINYI